MISLPYIFLILSAFLLWTKKDVLILTSIAASLIFALYSSVINFWGLTFLLVFALIAYLTFHNNATKYKHIDIALKVLIAIYAFILMLHVLPGFNNYDVLSKVQISSNAIPYSMYLNYDSLFVGINLILFNSKVRDMLNKNIKQAIVIGLVFGVITTIILATLAFSFGFIKWDFKLTLITLIFLIQNLIFTCFYEEAFWRGFLQNSLTVYLKPVWSIFITAAMFGIIHIIFAGISFAVLAFIAGIAYGVCYAYRKQLVSSILCHYLVNILQFIFVTYPILSSAIK